MLLAGQFLENVAPVFLSPRSNISPFSERLPEDWMGKLFLSGGCSYRLVSDQPCFIHELQDFGKRSSERSKRVSFPKSCSE